MEKVLRDFVLVSNPIFSNQLNDEGTKSSLNIIISMNELIILLETITCIIYNISYRIYKRVYTMC